MTQTHSLNQNLRISNEVLIQQYIFGLCWCKCAGYKAFVAFEILTQIQF